VDVPQEAVITATAAAPLVSRARFKKERRLSDAAVKEWLWVMAGTVDAVPCGRTSVSLCARCEFPLGSRQGSLRLAQVFTGS